MAHRKTKSDWGVSFAEKKGMSVADNLARIQNNLGDAPVLLVAVTKTASPSQIEEAFKCGVTEFAENRIQDSLKRRNALPPNVATQSIWHFIGHLQTNKVKHAVEHFDLIQSVDSLRLAEEISKEATRKDKIQRILLQVKVLPDESKSGFTPETLQTSFAKIASLENLQIDGLMTITPNSDEKSVRMNCFNGLRTLRDELARQFNMPLPILSMGMTDDWQDAIECGSNMIRVGRAIFGH